MTLSSPTLSCRGYPTKSGIGLISGVAAASVLGSLICICLWRRRRAIVRKRRVRRKLQSLLAKSAAFVGAHTAGAVPYAGPGCSMPPRARVAIVNALRRRRAEVDAANTPSQRECFALLIGYAEGGHGRRAGAGDARARGRGEQEAMARS